MAWVLFLFLLGLDTFFFIKYKQHKKTEEEQEREKHNDTKKLIEKIEDDSKVIYGDFKVKNTFDENEYLNIETVLENGTCLTTTKDEFYHTFARCYKEEVINYRFYKDIAVQLGKIQEAQAMNKQFCPICAYNSLSYDERIKYETINKEYLETKLVGSSSKEIQSFLNDLQYKFFSRQIKDNQLFFDYDIEKDRVAVIVLNYFKKDEYGDFSEYQVAPERYIIGYLPSSFITKTGKEKDEFESFTGLLKDINYDNSDKLYCEIILFLDQNKLTGIDLYKLEQKDKERL